MSAPLNPALVDRSAQKRGRCWKSPAARLVGWVALAS